MEHYNAARPQLPHEKLKTFTVSTFQERQQAFREAFHPPHITEAAGRLQPETVDAFFSAFRGRPAELGPHSTAQSQYLWRLDYQRDNEKIWPDGPPFSAHPGAREHAPPARHASQERHASPLAGILRSIDELRRAVYSDMAALRRDLTRSDKAIDGMRWPVWQRIFSALTGKRVGSPPSRQATNTPRLQQEELEQRTMI